MLQKSHRVLGLDIGIASIGWALIESGFDEAPAITAGVWTFDAPETDKERRPKASVRREHRGQRRVIRRRRQRMACIRRLFAQVGLLPNADKDALKIPELDPWRLRAEGLDRALTPTEFAVALGHIARHRGFKSNAKRDAGANAPDDTSKMKKAMEATRERLGQYRTVGEQFWRDPAFIEPGLTRRDGEELPVYRRRNRSGDYTRTVKRNDLEDETRALFAAQRRFGAAFATDELHRGYADIAFSQLPLQDSDGKVGACPFEAGEKRTARRAYSFELFRLLSKLTTLRLVVGREERKLTEEQVALAASDFAKQKSLTFTRLRKLLDLDAGIRFASVSPEREKKDVAASSGNCADGTFALRKAIVDRAGEVSWGSLLNRPEILDRIAEVLTFRENEDTIRIGLQETGAAPAVVDALMQALHDGELSVFKGAGHISAKAARALIPHLESGLGYSEACEAVGYDHARSRVTAALDLGGVRGIEAIRKLLREENETQRLHGLINNPVARKAVMETLKQVKAIVQEFGLPDAIHIELARDVGKSKDERDEISRGIEKRNREKDKKRAEFVELLHREPSKDELLRFELWHEQGGFCLYSNKSIHPRALIATDNSVQVDHILPWSRFGDDSFLNKTLCTASANQDKKGRTPFEWFQAEKSEAEWETFVAAVEAAKGMKGLKKRNYLLKNATEKEEGFRSRNLNDTRYAARVVADILRMLYPENAGRPVLARPGALTARLRQAWGIEALKKVNGERIEDDRHHAIDAMVIAATTESALQSLTEAFQRAEVEGRPQAFKGMELPWPSIRDDVLAAHAKIFVARAERHRARGKAHDATIKQIAERDGAAVVFERKAVDDKFTEKDLARIKDPDRNAATVDAIRAWIAAGKPKDAPPLSPKGDIIRKVRLETNDKVGVNVRGGAADRGNMARVDVFQKANTKGKSEFFLVPIYPHEIANFDQAPNHFVAGKGTEKPLDLGSEFLWSISLLTLLEITKSDGEVILGYFRGLDRQTGAVTVSPPQTLQEIRRGIGPRKLLAFRKLRVDRLGRVFEVRGEKRTWRGKVCT